MKKNLFNSVIVISVLALCVSCKKHSSTPVASNYKTLSVTTSDRTLYSNFSATIQGYPMPQVELWLSDRSEYPEKGKIDVISGTHAVVLWLHGKTVGGYTAASSEEENSDNNGNTLRSFTAFRQIECI